MTIREFQPGDAVRVAEIQGQSHEASQWEVQSEFCLLIESDQVMGFLVSRQVAPDEFELLNIAVDPSSRRQGMARELLQAAIERFLGTWFLEVRESNLPAQKLYEAVGFLRCGIRSQYYENPPEAAVIMKREA